jgi:protein required for attachment to host cells
MKRIWAIIANMEKAEIYSFERNTPRDFQLIRSLEHPASKQKSQQLNAAPSGQFGPGTGGHGTYAHNNPQQVEIDHFSQEIAKFIEHSKGRDEFDELALIAPPNFLGNLNQQLSKNCLKLVSVTMAKDYIAAIRDREIDYAQIFAMITRESASHEPVLNR